MKLQLSDEMAVPSGLLILAIILPIVILLVLVLVVFFGVRRYKAN